MITTFTETTLMKYIRLVSILLTFFSITLAEEIERQMRGLTFVGIQPGITVEPFDDRSVIDFNIIPTVFEITLHEHVGLRVRSILNLRFGENVATEMSSLKTPQLLTWEFKLGQQKFGTILKARYGRIMVLS